MGDRLPNGLGDDLAVVGLVSGRGTSDQPRPSLGVGTAGEEAYLARQGLHRYAVVRREDSEWLYGEADGEDFFLVDGGIIPVSLAGHFQEADPSLHTHQIAEEDVTRLDVLGPVPFAFSEAVYVAAG